jgi:hypothetical protein
LKDDATGILYYYPALLAYRELRERAATLMPITAGTSGYSAGISVSVPSDGLQTPASLAATIEVAFLPGGGAETVLRNATLAANTSFSLASGTGSSIMLQRTQLPPAVYSPSGSSLDGDSSFSAAAAIGGAIGGLVIIALIAVVVLHYCRFKVARHTVLPRSAAALVLNSANCPTVTGGPTNTLGEQVDVTPSANLE